jgi:hypothetical protein
MSMDYIRGPNLVAGTYTCGMEHGIEFGFMFTLPFEDDDQSKEDSLFDVVVGFVHKSMPQPHASKFIEQEWEKFRWVAEAIVNAAPPQGEVT